MRPLQIPLEAGIAELRLRRSVPGHAMVAAAMAPRLDFVGSTALRQRLDPMEIGAVAVGALACGAVVVQAHRRRVLQCAGCKG